jgi:hypothetical protein
VGRALLSVAFDSDFDFDLDSDLSSCGSGVARKANDSRRRTCLELAEGTYAFS